MILTFAISEQYRSIERIVAFALSSTLITLTLTRSRKISHPSRVLRALTSAHFSFIFTIISHHLMIICKWRIYNYLVNLIVQRRFFDNYPSDRIRYYLTILNNRDKIRLIKDSRHDIRINVTKIESIRLTISATISRDCWMLEIKESNIPYVFTTKYQKELYHSFTQEAAIASRFSSQCSQNRDQHQWKEDHEVRRKVRASLQ